MRRSVKICSLVLLCVGAPWTNRVLAAQDVARTPSEKAKEAVDKWSNAPASIGKSLQGLRDAAKEKLRQTVGDKPKAETTAGSKAEAGDLELPRKAPGSAAPAPAEVSRDPFRPMSLRAKINSRPKENLSPLERFDLSQLKVVGIVWDIKEPRAMVEDNTGLGYVVKVGTPMGNNDGTVKAIHRNQIIVEEFADDIYGVRKKREVSMNLPAE